MPRGTHETTHSIPHPVLWCSVRCPTRKLKIKLLLVACQFQTETIRKAKYRRLVLSQLVRTMLLLANFWSVAQMTLRRFLIHVGSGLRMAFVASVAWTI